MSWFVLSLATRMGTTTLQGNMQYIIAIMGNKIGDQSSKTE